MSPLILAFVLLAILACGSTLTYEGKPVNDIDNDPSVGWLVLLLA
jgi:hypothetical protein